ncbi:sortase [Candidatus Saccharibacteria bacterium]|nr:sortase [Candidatus Saccharibacteria bacterium]
MRPEDKRPTTPIVVPPRQAAPIGDARPSGAVQAADLVRGQIDSIYQNDPNATTPITPEPPKSGPIDYKPETKPQQPANLQLANQDSEATNPYDRTHSENEHQLQASSWQKYHSAWQSYYQQYYERYYMSQVHKAKESLETQSTPQADTNRDQEPISSDEAMYDLRSKLRNQINQKAQHVRKSRHFIPTMAAVFVMLVFLFLQYNRVMFAAVEAYVTPGNMDPSTIIVDPGLTASVGPDSRLIVPKINVDVPIVWNAIANSQDSLNEAMNHGVAWFNIKGASARPGEVGNFVLSGHSSNDWLDNGNYKFIFARLEQVQEGDVIYAHYNGVRYTYNVIRKEVVRPTDVQALTDPTEKPLMTLITCVPLGTADNRLLVFAEQVSPDPASAASSTPTPANTSTPAQMPSNSPTFLQRIFGDGN